MKIKEVKTWKFDELTDELKEMVIQKNYAFNVKFGWWDCTYEDAKTAGLIIDEFDTGRGSYCRGKFNVDAEDCAELIMKNHGSKCETFLTAVEYLKNRDFLVVKYSDGIQTDIVSEDNEYDFDKECDELNADFLKSICEDYLTVLSNEYDYLTGEDAIAETLRINEYDFDEHGNIA